jgi:hypothetical protein
VLERAIYLSEIFAILSLDAVVCSPTGCADRGPVSGEIGDRGAWEATKLRSRCPQSMPQRFLISWRMPFRYISVYIDRRGEMTASQVQTNDAIVETVLSEPCLHLTNPSNLNLPLRG